MHELNAEPNRRILVIDDNRSIHNDFKKILCRNDGTENSWQDDSALFGESPRCTSEHPVAQLSLDANHIPYEVQFASQGEEGLQCVLQGLESDKPFAMAFVDMRMPPGWDGMETITQLWRADADLEIVICTAFSDYSWSQIAGKVDRPNQLLILKKPFDIEEVTQMAACMTDKWNVARNLGRHLVDLGRTIDARTEQIERSRRETESLMTAISSLLIGVDENGIVHRWNKSAEDLFGVESADAVGKRLRELNIEWVDTESAERFFQTYEAGSVTKLDLKIVRDGSTRMIGASTYPVSDNGENRGVLCLGTDITEQCRREQQMQQGQKLEAVGQLAAGVAHEINTPMQYLGDNLDFLRNKMQKLTPVINNLEEFLDDAEPTTGETRLVTELRANLKKLKVKTFLEQVGEAIDDSSDGVQHVSRIVRAMKEFAHPGQEGKTPVDINRAIESTIAVSTNEWKYVAEIVTDLDATIPTIPGIAGELNQVFLNLIVNSAHAIGDTNEGGALRKGKITIATRVVGDFLEISMSDTGSGIPEAVRQRIFDPFFTTKEIGKGTGQGLAIAHSVVVTKHAGTLRCDSTPGVGTTFFVNLPLESIESETDGICEEEPAIACG